MHSEKNELMDACAVTVTPFLSDDTTLMAAPTQHCRTARAWLRS